MAIQLACPDFAHHCRCIIPVSWALSFIWLRELEAMPKTSDEGNVVATMVDIRSMPPLIRGFRVLKEVKEPIHNNTEINNVQV